VSALRRGPQLYSDALTKARLLSEQFSSVFTKDTPETAEISPLSALRRTAYVIRKLTRCAVLTYGVRHILIDAMQCLAQAVVATAAIAWHTT